MARTDRDRLTFSQMDIVVDLDQGKNTSLLNGDWEDLEYLVELLNKAFDDYEYRLEKVPGGKNVYLFVEDPLTEDSYECGIVERSGKQAYALSQAVHKMVMQAYQRYVDRCGEEGC